MTGPFADGYSDGLHDRTDWEHLHADERSRAKYLDGRACGVQDRLAGALEPLEAVSP